MTTMTAIRKNKWALIACFTIIPTSGMLSRYYSVQSLNKRFPVGSTVYAQGQVGKIIEGVSFTDTSFTVRVGNSELQFAAIDLKEVSPAK